MKNIIQFAMVGLLLVGSCFGTSLDMTLNIIPEDQEQPILYDEYEINNSENISKVLDEELKNIEYEEVYGLNIDENYYTVVMNDSKIKKIELNGEEKVQYNISMTKTQLFDYVERQHEMTWVDKAKFWIMEIKIPFEYVVDWKNIW